QRAKEVVEWRVQQGEAQQLLEEQQLIRTNKDQFSMRPSRSSGEGVGLQLIVKVEALLNILSSYDAQLQCPLDILHYGIGDISENDVNMANTFSGSVYGFNVVASKSIVQLAEKLCVPLRLHNIIYKLIDELKDELSSKLPPLKTENIVGEATVLAMFVVSVGKRKLPVAGCRVQKGLLDRRMTFRLIRGRDAIWEGPLLALKHHKDEVQTVKLGMECGLSLDGEVEFRAGDVVVCFEELETPQVTSWDPGF
ncbi:Translation initiation factor IF-2 mitochondrial, partial [Dissostichus eleginoides]